jgi:hypothetical protein
MPGRGLCSLLNPHSAAAPVTISHPMEALGSQCDVTVTVREAVGIYETRRETSSSSVILKIINEQGAFHNVRECEDSAQSPAYFSQNY